MNNATIHPAHAIARLAKSEASSDHASEVVAKAGTPNAATVKREVDAIYDDLIARLGETLATLSSDDVDVEVEQRAFRASLLRSRSRS